jgi:hypothetical protein
MKRVWPYSDFQLISGCIPPHGQRSHMDNRSAASAKSAGKHYHSLSLSKKLFIIKNSAILRKNPTIYYSFSKSK